MLNLLMTAGSNPAGRQVISASPHLAEDPETSLSRVYRGVQDDELEREA
ncbi:MAG: hypothetical protein U9N53_02805 [Bacteroidota bacterium]|nr:hypothetical protein [Bacteroidota bacterium]